VFFSRSGIWLRSIQSLCQKLYKHKLFDVGSVAGDSRMQGIYSPIYDESIINKYLHTQFLEGALTYQEKYQNFPHYRYLLSTAVGRISLRSSDQLTILDLGSGVGNTVIPLLELFPNSFVIATDLSKELLALLKRTLAGRGQDHRCALLQLNVEELDFHPSSFDLVVGAAILHHLFSPEKSIEECAKILKKGGYAIFFEPFELGYMILRLAYSAILKDPRSKELPTDVMKFLQEMIQTWDAMKGRDKSSPQYLQMDDKWLFLPKYFHELSKQYGFSSCTIYPTHPPEQQFEIQTLSNLRLVTGRGQEALPEWAWALIRECDLRFSDELKSDLIIVGCVILQRPYNFVTEAARRLLHIGSS